MLKSFLRYILFSCLFLLLMPGKGALFAQTKAAQKMTPKTEERKEQHGRKHPDTTRTVQADTTVTAPADTARASKPKGMLEQPVFSTARDSISEDFTNGKKMIYYYGGASVTYGNMSITADFLAYDIDKQTVYASGLADTSGTIVGKPVMKEGNSSYEMENVYYNFKSGKAKMKNMVTNEAEGILHGESLKMMPDKSFNISQGKYTVCDHPHPHYYLKMTVAKITTEPKQKTVFGPAYVVVEDVPLPLILPFGFVPQRPARSSGILFPTYGEEASRGIFLKDMGYYFVLGDYFDVALTGSLYSLGSWNVNMATRYKARYKFDGSLNLKYSSDRTGEKGSRDYFETNNFSVQWSHSQDSKARPGTSFRASVNFSSPSNSRYNSDNLNQIMQNQISSSISYSKSWSKMSLSINGLHSQNSRDSSYAITLPNITFNVNRFYPFKKKVRVGKEKFYEQISLSYNTAIQNKINFKAKDIHNPDFFSKMKNGMAHNFSIGLPSFTLLKYLNFSPGVTYGMNWHFQEQSLAYNPETDKVETRMSDQFSTFGITQNFSASLSMSTRIYGTFMFKGNSKLRAIRHMITPSLSFSYRPEMGTRINGYSVYNYVDKHGIERSQEYNRYAGGLYSPPGKGQTAGLGFSIANNIEAKVKDKNDTTGTGMKKVKLIDQLNISGSYNFLADSMKLSTIGIMATTSVFEKISLSGNLTFDPYAVNERGQRINKFHIAQQGGFNLARLTNASASISYSFQGKGKMNGNDGMKSQGQDQSGPGGGMQQADRGPQMQGGGGHAQSPQTSYYGKVYYHPITGEYIPGGWVYYLNPEVPWSVSLNYNYSYSRSYLYANQKLQKQHNHNQTLSVGAQVRLTKDLNINLNTGIDLTKLKLTTTQLSATLDLHCFQISISWIPTGQWESWSFRINAKASALADLLQFKKGSSFWDNGRH